VRNIFVRILTVVTVGLAMVLATQATAQAAGRAPNYKTQILAAVPNSGMDPSCFSKRIDITYGHYVWGQYFGGVEEILDPDIVLATDTYTWANCLYPENGYYRMRSSLNPDNPNNPTAFIEGAWAFGGPDREVTWGSFLDS
jgi:hypothetical protein